MPSGTGREPVPVRAQWTEQHGVVVGGSGKEERDKSRKHCDPERIRGRPYRLCHSVENRERENFSAQYWKRRVGRGELGMMLLSIRGIKSLGGTAGVASRHSARCQLGLVALRAPQLR